MNGDEFLQGSRSSEAEHGSLSSSKWQVRILSSIVKPAAGFLSVGIAETALAIGLVGLKR